MTIGITLLRRYSAVQVLCIGFIAAIACVIPMLWIPNEPILAIALFAALGLIQGASFAAIPQLNKTTTEQALANGTLAQAGNIANLCGMPLLLTLLNSAGLQTMFVVVIGCYLTAISFHLVFARQRT